MLEQVVNFRLLSATSSFMVLAYSYITVKNMNKNEAMAGVNIAIIVIKTTLDTITRITIIAMFVYLYNDGNLNTRLATFIYYSHVIIMLIINVLFNRSKPSCDKTYLIGLLLNSLSTFFSYNHYNYDNILKKQKKTQNHQPTFLRQAIYYTIFLVENLVLTTWSLSLPIGEKSWILKDEHGRKEPLTPGNIYSIFGLAWILQLLSFLLQIGNYATHPAEVTIMEIREKLEIYVVGNLWICKKGYQT